ncbi:MAG TPA: hypothetical protein PKN95_10470 [Verrucomicrobiota bacterium]|nr:hypothetical protein [Verrucomicrobiota bacterium]HNT14764.1 hypothetical protein [Verrucomicrobiota bacterium]
MSNSLDLSGTLLLSSLLLAVSPMLCAGENPAATEPHTCAVANFLEDKIPDVIAKGKFSLNVRARYENLDQEGGTPGAHAETIRTRLGYTTASLYGFQAMIEAENVTAANKDTYAAGPGSPVFRDVIADPTGTEINQVWLGYTYGDTNFSATVKGGREMLVWDNARFIGNVGWRQNAQTFDTAGFKLRPLNHLELDYNYLWKVHRIYGDDGALAAATSDFRSASHLLHAAFTLSPLAKLGAYTYLLDLKNERGGSAINSCASYGGFLTGTWTFDTEAKGTLGYRGEFAWQTDYADSPVDYDTQYYLGELKATYDRFALSAGCEVLGADNGQGFRTPLATLHAFNGWADVFTATPVNGLRDFYAAAGVSLPGTIPLNFVYHKFDSDRGGADYGQEYDVVASRKFGKHWTVLAKYAKYDGRAAPYNFDKQAFWAEIEFNF